MALISYGPTLATLVEVAKTLAEQGIRARVINARYIKPMDTTVLGDLGAKNTPVVTVEEAMLNGGLGSQIANYFTDHGYTNRIKRLGIDDTYIEHGDVEQILEDLGLTHDPLVHTIQQFLD